MAIEITFNYVQNIFKKLPIGYYLGRNIECVLSEGANSYYDFLADQIVVGFASIKLALEDAYTEGIDPESLVRSVLYHEVSHVILTPAKLKQINPSYARVINIFEDERIETILKHYYMRVNFKKSIIAINHYRGEEATNADSAFYYTVRFRHGKLKFINRVDAIIMKYIKVNARTEDSYTGRNLCNEYVREIIALYNDIIRDWEDDKKKAEEEAKKAEEDAKDMDEDETSDSADSSDSSDDSDESDSYESSDSSDESDESESSEDSDESSDSDSTDSDDSEETDDSNTAGSDESNDEESEDGEESEESESDSTSTNVGDSTDDTSDETDESSDSAATVSDEETEEPADINDVISDEELNDIINDTDLPVSEATIKKLIADAIDSIVNQYFDPILAQRFDDIIIKKNKQKKLNGSAISTYSGRLDPRLVARNDDYKWWAQQNRYGHIRQYSKVKITFVIDNSGSFRNNDTKMNTIIRTLDKLVGVDFEFDVITINTEIAEWPNTKKLFSSYGGNKLNDNIASVLKRHVKPGANNFFIVLFDGDAHTDDFGYRSNPRTEAFRHFDTSNTIIISDEQNKQYIDPVITKAKVSYTKNYCAEFTDAILDLLDRML